MKEYIVFTIIAMSNTINSPPTVKETKTSTNVYVKAFDPPTKENAQNVQTISYIRLPTDWEKVN